MNKVLYLIPIIILLLSCEQVSKKALFQATVFNSIVTSKEISLPNKSYVNGKAITAPPFTWQTLIIFEQNKSKKCLIYRIPFVTAQKSRAGILSLTELKKGETDCNQSFTKAPIISMKVKKLKVAISDKIKFNSLGKKEISIKFMDLGKDKYSELLIPLINSQTTRKYKRFHSFTSSLEIDLLAE